MWDMSDGMFTFTLSLKCFAVRRSEPTICPSARCTPAADDAMTCGRGQSLITWCGACCTRSRKFLSSFTWCGSRRLPWPCRFWIPAEGSRGTNISPMSTGPIWPSADATRSRMSGMKNIAPKQTNANTETTSSRIYFSRSRNVRRPTVDRGTPFTYFCCWYVGNKPTPEAMLYWQVHCRTAATHGVLYHWLVASVVQYRRYRGKYHF